MKTVIKKKRITESGKRGASKRDRKGKRYIEEGEREE